MNLQSSKTSILNQRANQIDKDLEMNLSSDEKGKFLEILSKFRQLGKCSSADYLRFIANILNFFKDYIKHDNITIYAIAGVIPSNCHEVEFNSTKGIVVGFDSCQIDKLLKSLGHLFQILF